MTLERPAQQGPDAARVAERFAARRRRDQRERTVSAAAIIAGLGFGATLGLAVSSESWSALAAPGGWNMAIGRVAGFAGAYLMLVMVVLMARIPALERAVGQDRLARWHKRIGGWPIALIAAHGTFITFGYAESARTGFLHQAWTLVDHYPDVLAATASFGLLLLVGVVSIRQIRRRVRYESWWMTHLYVYLALALAFPHQIKTGAAFLGHPLTQLAWETVWAAAAAAVLIFRIGLPLWRSAYHQLRVVEVRTEAPGVVSVICRGRRLDRLPVEGGQFFRWRFLDHDLWWHANPYSLSALPFPPFLRLTARELGEQSRALARLKPGTFVMIEGPYGAFTAERRSGDRVLLVGAGVGVTPVRALLEGLPPHVDASVIVRSSSRDELVLHDELTKLVEARGGRLYELIGPRTRVRLGSKELRKLVPDIRHRDVYVCGPNGFSEQLVAAVRHAGVPESRIHREAFAF